MSGRHAGKNVFITGAGSGFGRRTALRFAEEGAKTIYMVDYNQERLDKVAPEVEAFGAETIKINTDLGVMENCDEAIAQALAHDSQLDVMISNAAAWVNEPVIEHSYDGWRRVLAVNPEDPVAKSRSPGNRGFTSTNG